MAEPVVPERSSSQGMVLALGRLRDWRKGDEQSIVRHADDPLVSRYLRDRFPKPYTLSHAREWVAKNLIASPRTHFAIECDDAAVGGIGVELLDDVTARSATIGYWLGQEYWGKGIMTDAVRAMTGYAFANFDITHIIAEVFEKNLASGRVLEKAGYVLEGRLRSHIVKNGTTMDALIYGVVRPHGP